MEYRKFLESKIAIDMPSGHEPVDINPQLFDFQKDLVSWAVRRGRAAIFADCGLGKTPMQLEWARQVRGDINIMPDAVEPLIKMLRMAKKRHDEKD